MEGELWKRVYQIVNELGKKRVCKGLRFSDAAIAQTFFWAVLHDRPICWACNPDNWPEVESWRSRPSPATMSRRMRSEHVTRLLQQVEQNLRNQFPSSWVHWIDARPLPIGGSTQDRDARYGRAAGCKAKGYKLYAICDSCGSLMDWEIHPMPVSEQSVAKRLIPHLSGEGYLVGDTLYDSNDLYDIAACHGYQLVAPKRTGKGIGHHRHSLHRLRNLDRISRPFGRALLHHRAGIDRFFGHMSNFGGGLSPLPNWVRTLRRVRLWVQAKIILNAVRLTIKQRLTA